MTSSFSKKTQLTKLTVLTAAASPKFIFCQLGA